MDKITPLHLAWIFGLTFTAIGLSIAYQCRATLIGWWRAASKRYITSTPQPDPAKLPSDVGHRPYAVDQVRITPDLPDPSSPDLIPKLADLCSQLSDEQLLEVLALMTDDDGNWRVVESRVSRFIGGRVEDRSAQVRAVRGEGTSVSISPWQPTGPRTYSRVN